MSEKHEPQFLKDFVRKSMKRLRHRRFIFLVMSMMVAVADAGLLLYDVTAILLTEKPQYSTQSVTLLVLFIHLFGFYIAILGLIYSSLVKIKLLEYLANASVIANVTLFILRFTTEIIFIEYRQETHKPG